MKKILAIILLICVGFSTVYVGATDVASDDVENYDKELFIFDYLGVLNGQDRADVDTSKIVSRSEFVSMCVDVLGLDLGAGETIFYDVNRTSDCYDEVCYFVNTGVLTVNDDREFRPDDSILYGEALKILLNLAGYGDYVSVNGGYPFGYVNMANRFEVGLEKQTGDVLSYGDAMELILNVMTMGVYDLTTISTNSKHYTVSTDETLLSIHRNLRIDRGRIEATPVFSMLDSIADDDTVYIDGTEYKMYSELNVTGLEGNCIEFIYEDTQTKDIVLYVEKLINKKDVSISSKEYISFSPNNYTLSYYTNLEKGNTASVQIGKKWSVVFNGRLYEGSLAEAFEGFETGERKGSVEIKRSLDNEDAVLIINSYRRYVVKSFDRKTRVLYNKLATADLLKLDAYQALVIRKENGELVDDAEIVSETPLLVAESADKSFVDILMPEAKISATVQSINAADRIVKTEDENLTVDAAEWERAGSAIKPGTLYAMWIDSFGEIIYMTPGDAADGILVGFIAGAGVEKDFDTLNVKIRMLTQNDGLQIYEFAKRVYIDGIGYSGNTLINGLYSIPETEEINGFGAAEAASIPEKIRLKRQIVRYRLNSKNEITYIDTYNVNTEGGETVETTLTKYQKRFQLLEMRKNGSSNRFDRDILYSPTATQLFTVPWTDEKGNMINGDETWKTITNPEYQYDNFGGIKSEEDYMYHAGAEFTDWRYYNIDVYNYDINNPYADVIVHYDDFIGNGFFGQVCEITKTMDESGNIGHEIKTIGNTGEKVYFAELDSDVASVNVGDIIYGEYYENKVYNIKRIYDCQTREFIDSTSNVEYWYKGERTNTTDTYRQQNQFSKGTVVNMLDQCAFWKYEMDDTTTAYDEAADLTSIPFTVYEKERNGEAVVSVGTVDRIKDIVAAGEEDGSYIVCWSDLNRVVYAFVYNGR